MEGGLEFDDDVFFAHLSKQISLLIMDDDDDEDLLIANRALTQAVHPEVQASFPSYDQQKFCKIESKGTGVFIPRSSHPRRKSTKQGRSIASGNKSRRLFDRSSRGFPRITHSDNICSSYHDSSNLRRC
ncbi:uncharacterized protein LOC105156970 [Sesamum indicum]|uniref:Uncharacterized protein LOC105156970 n=1 Tax=Sesamum indicum TaxID=4182 RepID=A0A6I9SNC0_SESIN|nr:uncharacterized protein LOC105156970 [Sesamum indicum]